MARKAGSHAEITGPAIQDAALRLFCQSGYAATSMRQIAAEVGVRAGALYLYTPDKQTLLFDLLNDSSEKVNLAAPRFKGKYETLSGNFETALREHIGKQTGSAVPAELDKNTIEKLKGLGYIE